MTYPVSFLKGKISTEMKKKGCARNAGFGGYLRDFQKTGILNFKAKIANIAYDTNKPYFITKYVDLLINCL